MIVACVRSGRRYPFEYVTRLRSMVERHMPPIAWEFVCITDQPERSRGVRSVDIEIAGLPGWWAKMALFQKAWRAGHSVLYFDLDTVICGDLSPLVGLAAHLRDRTSRIAICENWTRLHGNRTWPCRYGSCVMILHSTLDDWIWERFERSRNVLMSRCERGGDQLAIEMIEPGADFLQDMLPAGYMCSYRSLAKRKPDGLAVINFGGSSKPHNCQFDWVKDQWQ